jgi:glycosyltransferase involved in cell wall biosynthesis
VSTTLPRISIIVPSYNQGRYIEQTILSIINQGYPGYELIIIDGGSTDNTIEVIQKYESKIAYWVSEKDNGQADAINKGLAKVTGEIFNWVNSDDFLEPGSLQLIGEYFLNNPGKNVLCGFTRCFYDEDGSTSHVYRMGIKKTAAETMLNVVMNQPGTFYRVDIVMALGGINSSLRYVFDDELWFRFLGKYGVDTIGTTEKLLAQFRLHKNSKSVFEGYEKFSEESKAIWLSIAKELKFDHGLVRLMESEVSQPKYEAMHWDNSFIDKVNIERFFAARYILTLMQQGNYKEARLGWKLRFKEKFPTVDRMLCSTFVKLFLLPGYFKN